MSNGMFSTLFGQNGLLKKNPTPKNPKTKCFLKIKSGVAV